MQRAYTWLQAQQPGTLPHWDHLKSPLQTQLLSGEYCFQPVTLAPTTNRFGEPETLEVWDAQDQLVLKAISLVLTDHLKTDFSTGCHHLEGRGGIKQVVRQTRDYLHNHSENRTNRQRDCYDGSLTNSLGTSPSIRPLSLVGRLLSSWALCSLLLLPLNVAHSATVSMTNAIGGSKSGSDFMVGDVGGIDGHQTKHLLMLLMALLRLNISTTTILMQVLLQRQTVPVTSSIHYHSGLRMIVLLVIPPAMNSMVQARLCRTQPQIPRIR